MKRWGLFFSSLFICLGLDQWSKLRAMEFLALGQTEVVIEGFLNWTLVPNPGAAMGLFADWSLAVRTFFFSVLAFIAVTTVIWVHRTWQQAGHWGSISLGFFLGGALGNFLDRIRFGFVVDFIDLHFKKLAFLPTFNLADCAVILSGLYLLGSSLRSTGKTYEKSGKVA